MVKGNFPLLIFLNSEVRYFISLFIFSIFWACSEPPTTGNSEKEEFPHLSVPNGFKLSKFAEVPNARSLARGKNGKLFVSNRSGDDVYLAWDRDGDFRADTVLSIFTSKNMPNGVAVEGDDLYICERSKLWRIKGIAGNDALQGEAELLYEDFPTIDHHGWKYIAFGPDGLLYIPVGAPCNNCLREERVFSSLTKLDPNNPKPEVVAEGIRNTVGFDWHPETEELWFTDNGRDWMGDNTPPCELNHMPQEGLHFGFPFCHGSNVLDPKFGNEGDCQKYVAPKYEFQAHVAPLGMEFYEGDQFPEKYRKAIFVCEHGSWNRSSPVGYLVGLVILDGNEVKSYEPFVTGFLRGSKRLGRPVDVELWYDGSLLISDDHANLVYRLSYQ